MKTLWVGEQMWQAGVKRCKYYGLTLHICRIEGDTRQETIMSIPDDVAKAIFDDLLNVVVNGVTEVGSQRELAGASPAAQDASAEPLASPQPEPAAETV